MSTGGKIALAGSIVFTSSIIYYVVATQEADKVRMKQGVKKYLEEKAQQGDKTLVGNEEKSKNADSQSKDKQ